MLAKFGYGLREDKGPGPGGGWFKSSDRIRCVPFEPAYAAVNVPIFSKACCRVKFQSCRLGVTIFGDSVLSEAGGMYAALMGNGSCKVSKEVALGVNTRIVKYGGL